MAYQNQLNRVKQGDRIHRRYSSSGVKVMSKGSLGKVYKHGDTIIRQGDAGKCMYVIQEGEVEVVRSCDGNAVRLAVLGPGDIFGEISLLGNGRRSATVLAFGEVRVITVDKKVFLQRLQEDLTLAFRIFQTMAARTREMNLQLAALKGAM
jgi:CRP/FNR family cyclic AMP-dependent transcriptional regulator